MDWGLAKVLDQGGVADEERPLAGRDDGGRGPDGADAGPRPASRGPARCWARRPTWPPSRPAGALDTLDERADVFGLGSILCEILTGPAGLHGRSTDEASTGKAERADLADALARLDACGADGELVALARSCLAAAPKDRPRDAGVVLAGLTGHLAGVGSGCARPSWRRPRPRPAPREERRSETAGS